MDAPPHLHRRAMPPPPLPQDPPHIHPDEPLGDKYKKLKRRYQDMENKFNAMSIELHRAGEQNRRLSREKDMLLDRIIELQTLPTASSPRSRSPISTLGTPRHSPGPSRRHPDAYQQYSARYPHPNQLSSQPRSASHHRPLTPGHDAALQRVLDEDSDDEQFPAFPGRRTSGGLTLSSAEFGDRRQQVNGATANGSREYAPLERERERYPYPPPAPAAGPPITSPSLISAYPPPEPAQYARYRHPASESGSSPYYTPYPPAGQTRNDNGRSPPLARPVTPTPGFAPAQFPSPSPPPTHEYGPGPPVHGNGGPLPPHAREKRSRGGEGEDEAARKRARTAAHIQGSAPDALALSAARPPEVAAHGSEHPSAAHIANQHPSSGIKEATPPPPPPATGTGRGRGKGRARGRGRGAATDSAAASGRKRKGKNAKVAEPVEGTITMSNGVVIARDQEEGLAEHPRGGSMSTVSVAATDHTAVEHVAPAKANGNSHTNANPHPHPIVQPEPKDVDPPIPPPSLPPNLGARGGSTPPRPTYSPAPPAPPPSGPPPRDRSHLPAPPPPPLVPPRPRSTKPKRLKAHTVQSRSFSIPCVPRTTDGQPQLPLNVGIMTVRSLGQVCLEKHFHTERYIFPIGYEVTRRYLSMHQADAEAQYTCTILRGEDIDGGSGPRFRITPSDDMENPITAGTATGAWSVIVKAANRVRNRQHSNSVSGPDYFGLGQNTIKHLLQELDGANLLSDYVRQKFVEGGPLGGRHAAVTAAVNVDDKAGDASGSSSTPEKFGAASGPTSKPSSPAEELDEDDEDEAAMDVEHDSEVGNTSFVRGTPPDMGSPSRHDSREREGHHLPSLPSIDSFNQPPPAPSSSHSRSPTVSLAGHRSPPPLHVGPPHAQRYSPGPAPGVPSGLKGLMNPNPYAYPPPPHSHRRPPSPIEYGHRRHSPGPPGAEYHRPEYDYRERRRSPPRTNGSPTYSNGSSGHT